MGASAADAETLPPSAGASSPGEAGTLPPGPAGAAPAAAEQRPEVPGYEVLGELGRGGMGVVYKARQVSLKRLVALKMILGGPQPNEDQLSRFRKEAEALARIQHPNIVQVYEIGDYRGWPFFSLEYVDGGSLADRPQKVLPPRRAAAHVATLARAVHAAHRRGVVHRDLKPGNVLLTSDGDLKITDFGLAKRLDDLQGQTQTGAILGTPAYMAPEQAGGSTGRGRAGGPDPIGPAVDVYALGAILYELLTGRPPFQAATPLDTILQVVSAEPTPPSQLRPDVPRDLETICLKCLRKDPRQRYATAANLAEDLRRFLARQPVQARRAATWTRAAQWARRRPVVALLAVNALLIALGVPLALRLMATPGLPATHGPAPELATPVPAPPAVVPTPVPRPAAVNVPAKVQGKATPEMDVGQIYQRTVKSTVLVLSTVGEPSKGIMQGTGFVVDAKRKLIVTAHHLTDKPGSRFLVGFPTWKDGQLVTERARQLEESFRGRVLAAALVWTSPTKDLALLRVEAELPPGVEALPLAEHSAHVGQRVHCVGNPGASGALWVYHTGVVSQVSRSQWSAGADKQHLYHLDARVVETAAMIGSGEAGAPLVDDAARLVAMGRGGVTAGVPASLFIDVSEVRAMLDAYRKSAGR